MRRWDGVVESQIISVDMGLPPAVLFQCVGCQITLFVNNRFEFPQSNQLRNQRSKIDRKTWL